MRAETEIFTLSRVFSGGREHKGRKGMNGLFSADSVAVIGVSDSEDNLGKNILTNLINFGYRGKIYPVGPRGGEIFGHRIYRSVAEIPDNPELAVILTPARFVPDILAQCGEKGTRWAVIESGGFRELGAEGEALEKEIMETATRYGLRFVGPNCLGTLNTAGASTRSLSLCRTHTGEGASGCSLRAAALGFPWPKGSALRESGISKLVSMGNKLSLDEADYLAYLADDPDTAVIYFYLEDIKRGRVFADAARQCAKPIVLHKSNTSSLSLGIGAVAHGRPGRR